MRGTNTLHLIVSLFNEFFIQTQHDSGKVFPAGNYMFKVNNGNSEICSKLTIKIPERRRRRSGVFIVNFEHISHFVLVFLLLTLSRKILAGL